MQSGSTKPSPLDLLSAILAGSLGGDGLPPGTDLAAAIAENQQLLAILTTSVAVLVGCAFIFFRRSLGKKPAALPKPLVVKVQPEAEVDDGKKKVTVFFGTQTGTAEGYGDGEPTDNAARFFKWFTEVGKHADFIEVYP
ncbi:hypothetical protein BHE74_00007453 [Ensete ventricosum]|nr:hypothetical protein GW17_00003281 [Ensete ventricosum]RWW83991.1 hypothetical protein BHE74_00007453 [Ensete ventricosum]RZR85935.1 hypothetical protein BHM03_00013009 [Ensete ventricosum]